MDAWDKVVGSKTDAAGYAYADEAGFSFGPAEVFFAKVRERQAGNLKCRATESDPVVYED